MTCFSPSERCTLPPPQIPSQPQKRVVVIRSSPPPAQWRCHWCRRDEWGRDDLPPPSDSCTLPPPQPPLQLQQRLVEKLPLPLPPSAVPPSLAPRRRGGL